MTALFFILSAVFFLGLFAAMYYGIENDNIFVGIVGTVAMMLLSGWTFALGANSWERNHCENVVSVETGLKTKYVDWHDCYVTLDNGRTVPYERWIEEDED